MKGNANFLHCDDVVELERNIFGGSQAAGRSGSFRVIEYKESIDLSNRSIF
jgi:hypothetical protein